MKIPTQIFTRLIACSSFVLAFALAAPAADAQSTQPSGGLPSSLNVFLDCGMQCDEEFIRTEITYLNWVRDRAAADVHLLVTTQNTGGGGTEFTLAFLGLQRFAGIGDTLRFVSSPTATADETRHGLIGIMKAGLVRFVARTALAERLEISLRVDSSSTAGDARMLVQHDPWNFWVFSTSFNGNANGDRNNTFSSLGGNVSARRTTDAWKINLSANENYNQSDFTIDSGTSTFIRRSYTFSQLFVKSFGPRLSAGWTSSIGSSTFENKRFSLRATPAVELDIFPYSESTRRMLTLQYSAGIEAFNYHEETIYGKLRESHAIHVLAMSLSQNQPWGSVNLGLEGGQYLDATYRNYASLFGGGSVRLFKGFNFNLALNYSALHNQIYLPRVGATEQEILTQQRQLQTNYSYFWFMGLSYTFGSVLNNIVNPRFGRDGGGGGMMISF